MRVTLYADKQVAVHSWMIKLLFQIKFIE